ncbi:hypothetical protein L2E82_00106 [Cichorium intybus]|uniref:Uncharacterized protein n=1 Tax=Cichorium intybus TaxID=13427 RepID=A0ACB9GVV7_CICIN|nr:hypothetical protein L2E82_00106 [Cichorium intybus]
MANRMTLSINGEGNQKVKEEDIVILKPALEKTKPSIRDEASVPVHVGEENTSVGQLSLMENESNFKIGTQLARSDSGQFVLGVDDDEKKYILQSLSELEKKFQQFSMANDINNWICNIEQHASNNVNKILVGNKPDMDESKRGQSLAETDTKTEIPEDLWVGYVPIKMVDTFPGLYLFTSPSRFVWHVRPKISSEENNNIELIGNLEYEGGHGGSSGASSSSSVSLIVAKARGHLWPLTIIFIKSFLPNTIMDVVMEVTN